MSEAEKPGWYETGYTGVRREEDRIASQQGPRRLYMKANESHQIVFVDDNPFVQSGSRA